MIFWSNIFYRKKSVDFWWWKMTLKVQILQTLRRLFIILVALTVTWCNEKLLIFRHDLMPNFITKILDGIYSADDVRSNNICCLSKLWQLRLALLSNVALLVWCHSRYFSTFIGHGKQRKYQNYFQCTNLATCIRSDTMKPK